MHWLDRLTGWWPNPFAPKGLGFRGGIALETKRHGIDRASRRCPLPDCLIVPVKQHIGKACRPIVRPGDRVRRGQTIARAEEYLAADVHAPTSGIVTKIEEHRVAHPSGLGELCVFIEPDGEDARCDEFEPILDWAQRDPVQLRERLRRAGLVGMGGAGFPTFAKLACDREHPIEWLILNAMECEPYFVHDARLISEQAQKIARGAAILAYMLQARRIVVAIEDDKPGAAEAMRKALDATELPCAWEVRTLPSVYPHGSEKQLIEAITGKEVPAGGLPLQIGVVCQNVATVFAVQAAIEEGTPLIERLVTVSGEAVPEPGAWQVAIGTPIRFLLAKAGLSLLEEVEIIHGGPMMGERIGWPEAPVVKNTTGILALPRALFRAAHPPEEPCIRCGRCGQVCPAGLVPNLLMEACKREDVEEAERLALFDCIECGCCSYVCPAHIPLVHYFRFGKGLAAEVRRAREFAEASRRRSEARKARLEREKAARMARRRKTRAQPTDDGQEGGQ